MKNVGRQLGSLLLACGLFATPWSLCAQERAMVPLTIDGDQAKLVTITYKPAGDGPFPTLIFHHGSGNFERPYDPRTVAQWFMARGWAVIAPSRRGRGGSEGVNEEWQSCSESMSLEGADRALRDIEAVTPALMAKAFVDRSRIAVGGQSRGGLLSVAWSGKHPEVRAVVNFVGGWIDSRTCRHASAINQSLLKRGVAGRQPSLWLYGDNDLFYSLEHTRANFDAFQAAGGKGVWHDYKPPEGLNGHQIGLAPQLWTADLEAYLAERGLPAKLIPAGAQAIDGNTIKVGGIIYRLWGIDAPDLGQRCYPDGWPAGFEAARGLAAMIERRPVTCEAKTADRYGRTVALCRAGGRDIGAAMVVAGLALAVSHGSDDYVELEARAMQARAGVHGHACLAPGEWREQRRHSN